MINIKVDTHTHTIASTHAYCTIMENAKYASTIGMEAIAITDHSPSLCDSPHVWHFHNLKAIPRELYGVKILYGIEADILDPDGHISLEDDGILNKLDVVNASIHSPAFSGKPGDDCTKAYEAVIKNPAVDIICHSGNPNYPYDYEKIVCMAKEYNKLIEINNHSFYIRKSSIPNCLTLANLCMEHSTGIVVSSDAHFCSEIGEYSLALKALEDINFPEELIINRDLKSFQEFISRRKELFRWNL